MKNTHSLIVALCIFFTCLQFVHSIDLARIETLRRLSSSRESSLNEAYISPTPGKRYQYPVKILYLKGSHQEIGYDYGFIVSI